MPISSRVRVIFFIVAGAAMSVQPIKSDAAEAESPRPLIVAHRGASHDAPENTLAAFRLAWEKGADCIEGDFYLSADGEIVCIHDSSTKKTAGVNKKVAKTTFEELRKLDVGSWKGEQFKGEKIPTLDEVLATVPEGKTILIEIKCGPEIVPVLKEKLAASDLKPEQTIVIAFDEHVVAATKEQIPEINAYWLTGYKEKMTGGYKPSLETVLSTLRRVKADGLDTNANEKVVDEEFVRQLRDAGMEFHIWTVNDPQVAARFRKLGVDSITTDRPAFLREHLKKQP